MSFILRFFTLVLVLSFAELYLLIELASKISVGLTLALCVLTGVIGGAMVRAQGLKTLAQIQRDLSQGSLPGERIVSGLILLIIGTMLLTPGFITDTLAFLLLVPSIRQLAARALMHAFKNKIQVVGHTMDSRATSRTNSHHGHPEDVVIEVDAEEVKHE